MLPTKPQSASVRTKILSDVNMQKLIASFVMDRRYSSSYNSLFSLSKVWYSLFQSPRHYLNRIKILMDEINLNPKDRKELLYGENTLTSATSHIFMYQINLIKATLSTDDQFKVYEKFFREVVRLDRLNYWPRSNFPNPWRVESNAEADSSQHPHPANYQKNNILINEYVCNLLDIYFMATQGLANKIYVYPAGSEYTDMTTVMHEKSAIKTYVIKTLMSLALASIIKESPKKTLHNPNTDVKIDIKTDLQAEADNRLHQKAKKIRCAKSGMAVSFVISAAMLTILILSCTNKISNDDNVLRGEMAGLGGTISLFFAFFIYWEFQKTQMRIINKDLTSQKTFLDAHPELQLKKPLLSDESLSNEQVDVLSPRKI